MGQVLAGRLRIDAVLAVRRVDVLDVVLVIDRVREDAVAEPRRQLFLEVLDALQVVLRVAEFLVEEEEVTVLRAKPVHPEVHGTG